MALAPTLTLNSYLRPWPLGRCEDPVTPRAGSGVCLSWRKRRQASDLHAPEEMAKLDGMHTPKEGGLGGRGGGPPGGRGGLGGPKGFNMGAADMKPVMSEMEHMHEWCACLCMPLHAFAYLCCFLLPFCFCMPHVCVRYSLPPAADSRLLSSLRRPLHPPHPTPPHPHPPSFSQVLHEARRHARQARVRAVAAAAQGGRRRLRRRRARQGLRLRRRVPAEARRRAGAP